VRRRGPAVEASSRLRRCSSPPLLLGIPTSSDALECRPRGFGPGRRAPRARGVPEAAGVEGAEGEIRRGRRIGRRSRLALAYR
jgi:hypothetical protein